MCGSRRNMTRKKLKHKGVGLNKTFDARPHKCHPLTWSVSRTGQRIAWSLWPTQNTSSLSLGSPASLLSSKGNLGRNRFDTFWFVSVFGSEKENCADTHWAMEIPARDGSSLQGKSLNLKPLIFLNWNVGCFFKWEKETLTKWIGWLRAALGLIVTSQTPWRAGKEIVATAIISLRSAALDDD